MANILEGVRVLEVAQWWFVPAAAAALADWGADVIKIEHPEYGDPMRGLRTGGGTLGGGPRSFMFEQPNRGKRSVGIDIKTDAGRDLVLRLAAESDVFITSFLPDARRRLGIDVDDLRAVNPRIIYARGHGQGADGPDNEKGGYDAASFWARGGIGHALTPPSAAHPTGQRAAFGDSIGAITLAGGIAAALFGREHTGEATVVDVSLLGTASWVLAPDTIAARQLGTSTMPAMSRSVSANPIVNSYKTKDGRWIMLVMMESDRFWPELCVHLDRPELVVDERFADAAARAENAAECVAILEQIFESATLAEWRERLANIEGVWSPMQSAGELHDDPQVIANNYITYLEDEHGEQPLVRAPVQFDGERRELSFAPFQGEHTVEVLAQLGIDSKEIDVLRDQGVVN
jgi:crotonobetainyl-CoA:carnitine CoA-transferase CaiB-like acyl-CoA transferase